MWPIEQKKKSADALKTLKYFFKIFKKIAALLNAFIKLCFERKKNIGWVA